MRQLLSPETLLASFSALRSILGVGSGERLLPEGNDRAPDWGQRMWGGVERVCCRPDSTPGPIPNPTLPWEHGQVSRNRVPASPEHQHPGASRSQSRSRSVRVPLPVPALVRPSAVRINVGAPHSEDYGGGSAPGSRRRRRRRRRIKARPRPPRPGCGGGGGSAPGAAAPGNVPLASAPVGRSVRRSRRRVASAPSHRSHRIPQRRRVPVPWVPDSCSSRPVPSRSSPGWRVPVSLGATSSLPSFSRIPRLSGPGLSAPLVSPGASGFVLPLLVPGSR